MAITAVKQEPLEEVNPRPSTGGTPAPVYKVPSGRATAGRLIGQRRYYNRASGRMESAEQMKRYRRPAAAPRPSTRGASVGRPGPAATGTGINPNAPYEPWASPYKTQGQFERGVSQIAKTMYGPKLGMLGEEESGARNLYKERESENEKIYKAYTEQAQKALATARDSLAGIASSTNAQGLQSQELLNTALKGGPPGLGESPDAAKFLERAAQETGFTQQSLAQKQSSILNELGSNAIQVPLAGRNEARTQENQTLQDTLGKLQSERGRVAEEEPNDIARARAELTKEETNRAATRLQRELTGQKIGQEGELKREANQVNLVKAQGARASAEERNRTTRNKEEEAKKNKDKVLRAKQYANAVKWFAGNVGIKKGEEFPQGRLNPAEEKALTEKGEVPYHARHNAQESYETLTKVYGLNARQAWEIMRSGGGYFKVWVEDREREQRGKQDVRAGRRPKSYGPALKTTNKRGGPVEIARPLG